MNKENDVNVKCILIFVFIIPIALPCLLLVCLFNLFIWIALQASHFVLWDKQVI
jgi:hypothetical protein